MDTTTLLDEPVEKEIRIGEMAETVTKQCVCTRVRQLSRVMTHAYDDALRPLGITGNQFTLLMHLAQEDAITAAEIGSTLDIEKSTLSRNLKRLLTLGHLTMDPPAGRRGRALHLTPRGESVIKRAYPAWKSVQLNIISAIGHDGRHGLDTLLAQVEKLHP